MNIGRNAALAAGFPDTVPGTTVDRQCGSAQQAIHFAAQAVMSGAMDIVIGAGVESMTRVPIGSTTEPGPGEAYGPTVHDRFEFIHQGLSAEEIARRWDIGRDEMDAFALQSHRRAARAQDEGRFANEIVALASPGPDGDDHHRGRRRGPPRDEHREARQPGPRLPRGRHHHRRDVVADLRRGRGGAGHERGAGRGSRTRAPGPLPHLRRGGQRPGHHAHRAHPGHPRSCWRRPS